MDQCFYIPAHQAGCTIGINFSKFGGNNRIYRSRCKRSADPDVIIGIAMHPSIHLLGLPKDRACLSDERFDERTVFFSPRLRNCRVRSFRISIGTFPGRVAASV